MLQSDRYWVGLCEVLGRPELATDPRFVDADARAKNSEACVAELDLEFGKRTLDDCVALLERQQGPWAIHRRPIEIFDDEQVRANGYLRTIEAADGSQFELVANPVQFDETPPALARAPEAGEHTETVLLERGCTWEQLAEWKADEVIS
jgi:crotonobetainyl-CoA:carnitine CoA-transferase CaiB-like acyl-CoA transferase